MSVLTIREQLHQQIDNLPDDLIEQVADFTLFVMAKRKLTPHYIDWNGDEWQEFVLGQLFNEDDEISYSLDDAEEVYHS